MRRLSRYGDTLICRPQHISPTRSVPQFVQNVENLARNGDHHFIDHLRSRRQTTDINLLRRFGPNRHRRCQSHQGKQELSHWRTDPQRSLAAFQPRLWTYGTLQVAPKEEDERQRNEGGLSILVDPRESYRIPCVWPTLSDNPAKSILTRTNRASKQPLWADQ